MDGNPFDDIDPNAATPSGANPFDSIGPEIPDQSSATGAFVRTAAQSAIPAAGGFAGAGLGAETGGAIGALAGPVGAVFGGAVGGIAGFFGGSYALQKAQNYALSKLPDSWQDTLGSSERQQRIDQGEHPIASFLGGIAPYALTMSPDLAWKSGAALPENATAFQRVIANPLTRRLFGGAAMGGMELGQEALDHENLDWRKAAIATGFGLVFNKPNRIGEAITAFGARAALPFGFETLHGVPAPEAPTPPEPAPTVAEAGDLKVMGPGVTESVFQGQEQMHPGAEQAAQENARVEQSVIGEPPAPPDIHQVARRIDPETFQQYDALNATANNFRRWIRELDAKRQSDFAENLPAADAERDAQSGIDDLLSKVGGVEARLTKRQAGTVADLRGQLAEAQKANAEGPTGDNADMAQIRRQLQAVDFKMRDLAPQVSAAYRRAQEVVGTPAVEPETNEATGAEPPGPASAGAETTAPPQAAESAAGAEQQISSAVPAQPEPIPAPTPPNSLNRGTAAAPPLSIEGQRGAIIADVASKLVAARRPADEAEAAGQLLAARYETRAARMKGALGTADELYRQEGPDVRQAFQTGRQRVPELAQSAKGKIQIGPSRSLITLSRDADASTFIHETGHQWLEELMRDSAHEAAPDSLKADAQSVRNWLGAKDGEPIKTRQHEKFARGFEQYMREGVAPSAGLARVFGQFRQWLTTIYQTLRGLGKPISDDIRGVFDRLLAEEPQRTVIAPERENASGVSDVHEEDAALTEPHEAEPVADRIAAESDRFAVELPPEIQNELTTAAPEEPADESSAGIKSGPEAGANASETGALVSRGGQSEPVPGSGGGGDNAGEVGGGGIETTPDGAGLRSENQSAERGTRQASGDHALAPGPADLFGRPESSLVDKAGNIRVENLTDQADIARAIHESADRNNDFVHVRGQMTRGQMMDLADSMNLSPDKMSESALANLLGGTANLAPRILAARKLVIQSAGVVSDLMRKAAESQSDQDAMALAQAIARHDMIQSALSGTTADWGRAGTAFKSLLQGWYQAQDVNAILTQNTGRTLFQLKRIAKLGARLDDPAKISKFVRDSRKPSFGRMIFEYWVNGLISGPATHMTYAIANQLTGLERSLLITPTASAIGAVHRGLGEQRETVRLGEVGARVAGMARGVAPAVKSAATALRTGATTLLPGEESAAMLPLEGAMQTAQPGVLDINATWADAAREIFAVMRGVRDGVTAAAGLARAADPDAPAFGVNYSPLGQIPDLQIGRFELPIGTVARLPSRMIAAIHSFGRAMEYSTEIAARSFRTAATEGLSGEQFAARVGDLRQNPTVEMMNAAQESANNATLMSKGGPLMQRLSALLEWSPNVPGLGETPILRFVDPFVKISGAITKGAVMERTPFGILSPEIRADLMGKNGAAAQEMTAAKMIVGSTMAVMFAGLAGEGYVTGSGPSDPRKMAIWRMAGYQPYSIRIGDTWYQYHRLGPLGMLAGIAADMYDTAHQASTEGLAAAAASFLNAFTHNFLDESWARGPSDLLQAIQDHSRYGQQYVRNFVSSFTPFSVGMAQMARASDPYVRQARTITDAIKQHIPGLSETLLPRRDIWGEPLPSGDALLAPGLTAIYEQRMNSDPVNQAMYNLGITKGRPRPFIRNVRLTDQEYDDYQRIAGRMLKMRMNAIVRSPDFQIWPNDSKVMVINRLFEETHETAANIMMMRYPSIAAAAAQAKRNRFRAR